MRLRDLVVEGAIIPRLKATKRDDAVAELAHALVEASVIPEAMLDEYIKLILKREKRGSTGFGHGVAVPHVKHDSIKSLSVAVGVSEEGVEFNSLDKQPVHSIFLLLSPESRPDDHVDAMKAIFDHLQQERFRSFLRQSETVEDIIGLLEEADAKSPR